MMRAGGHPETNHLSKRKIPRLLAARSKRRIAKSNCGQSLGMTDVRRF